MISFHDFIISVGLLCLLLVSGCGKKADETSNKTSNDLIVVEMHHRGEVIGKIKKMLDDAKCDETVELLVATVPQRNCYQIAPDLDVLKGHVRFETKDGFIDIYPNNELTIGLNGRPERKYTFANRPSVIILVGPNGPPCISADNLARESVERYKQEDNSFDYYSQSLETRVVNGKRAFVIRIWRSPDFEGSVSTWKIFHVF